MTEKPQQTSPPRQTLYAACALAASGLFAIIGGLVLLGNKTWIRDNRRDALNKIINDKSKSAKDIASAKKSLGELGSYVDTQVKASIIGAVVTLLLCAFLAYSVYRGRHWSRWGVVGVWVLSTVTGSFISLFVLLGFASSSTVPGSLRIPIVAAGVAYVIALVLVNLRPSVEYFAKSRPERLAGRPARGGLFGPRPPRGGAAAGRGARTPAATRPAASSDASSENVSLTKGTPDRSRTKQRASAEAVAKGADLARTRAKAASKSRRTGS